MQLRSKYVPVIWSNLPNSLEIHYFAKPIITFFWMRIKSKLIHFLYMALEIHYCMDSNMDLNFMDISTRFCKRKEHSDAEWTKSMAHDNTNCNNAV